MDETRDQRLKDYTDLLSVKAKAEKDLFRIPGVVAVSVGLKVTNGSPTGDLCLRVYVDEKKPADEIPESEKIPPRLQDVPTDVDEVSKDVTSSGGDKPDYRRYRPLCGGIAVKTAKSPQTGTLGCLVEDNSEDMTGEIFLLTTFHILKSNGEEKGHQVGQPDFCCERCCCRCGEIAKIERWGDIDADNVDCAIAVLSNDQENNWNNEVLELGPVRSIRLDEDGTPIHPLTDLPTFNGQPYQPVLPFDTVFKRGFSSLLKEGLVIDPTAPATVGYRSENGLVFKNFTKQILIHPKIPGEAFVSKGDSGAVVVNHLNEVVGLHFADNEVRDDQNVVTSKATKSFANPIQDVLKVLQVSIPATGTSDTLPLRSGNGKAAPPGDALDELTRKIESQPDGPLLIEAFKRHGREVVDLIHTDKEVKVAWNRLKGPVFTAHLMEKSKDPAFRIPLEIENVSYRRLLLKMSVVREKKGSPELAADIEKYSIKALALVERLVSDDVRTGEI